jgi:hypothetical protein
LKHYHEERNMHKSYCLDFDGNATKMWSVYVVQIIYNKSKGKAWIGRQQILSGSMIHGCRKITKCIDLKKDKG